jgi:SEC-C motif-containing protein
VSGIERSDDCPCGTGRRYERCCGRYHDGDEPPDAETLMRSRFTAFAVRDFDYLWRTLHPDHEDRAERFDGWRARIAASTKPLSFRTLRILATREPDADGVAHVLFHVVVTEGKKNRSFAEHSRFAHDGTGWRYLDGGALPMRDAREIEKLTFDLFHHLARR